MNYSTSQCTRKITREEIRMFSISTQAIFRSFELLISLRTLKIVILTCIPRFNFRSSCFIFFISFILFFSAPLVGIFGGAGQPVFRAMMSKIVSTDDQGKDMLY